MAELAERPVASKAVTRFLTFAVDERRFGTCGDEIDDGFLQCLPIYRIVFVPDHQVDGQPFESPVGMRLHRLAHQGEALVVTNPQQHDGHVPRNAITPQP